MFVNSTDLTVSKCRRGNPRSNPTDKRVSGAQEYTIEMIFLFATAPFITDFVHANDNVIL